ncbi:hypothetical protein C8A05DRAFT_15925 [Staphylotrichum tortipilum]|uniref:F-box domain-containing protein n=1 Tax=Staphylotrichum tortipilum TaxID=2831512 RepID=A0AAN6RT92_9PEZI|nr:hypothetical protein C8A05DRAFT_15925 [Staphylotrichum longicolle]
MAASIDNIQAPAAAGQPSPPTLQSLPVEILLEILSSSSFSTIENLLLTSRRLHAIISTHWPAFMSPILTAEFSPVQPFFDTYTTVDLPPGMSCTHLLAVCNSLPGASFAPLLAFCRAIRRWEAEFPRLRFGRAAHCSRALRPHEAVRLRGALYVWWRYARRFHGPEATGGGSDGSGGGSGGGSGSFEATRAFVRALSTTELHEVYDLWTTVRGAVGRKVCPSVSVVRGGGVSEFIWSWGKLLTEEEGARVGWGDVAENCDILDTMLKLSPENILHLLVYRHRYATKASVVQFIRLRHPRIEDSVETFSHAMLDLMELRSAGPNWPFPCTGYPGDTGGILDHKQPDQEQLRAVHASDGGTGTPAGGLWWGSAGPTVDRPGRLELRP